MEDLWIKPTTPQRVRRRALKRARDLVVTIEVDEVEEKVEEERDELGKEEASRYRAAAARLNFLAQDRPDLQFLSKESSRRMAVSREGDWELLKKAWRYLIGC